MSRILFAATRLDDTTHDQTIICRQLSAGHVVGFRPKERKKTMHQMKIIVIYNGNRTEWSPIRSVITRVITKSDDCEAGVRFVDHEYDYRLKWTTVTS